MIKHKITAYIKRLSDGKIVKKQDWVPNYNGDICCFDWEEGNSSCDCNRHIYFEGHYCDSDCGDQVRYMVNIKSRETGEWLYQEYMINDGGRLIRCSNPHA